MFPIGPILLIAMIASLAGIAASRRFPRLWLALTLAGAASGFAAAAGILGGAADW